MRPAMEQLYAPSIGSPIETPTPPRRSRLVGLALLPEPRPTARRPPTRVGARGDEPRRTEFDLQGQYFWSVKPSSGVRKYEKRDGHIETGRRAERQHVKELVVSEHMRHRIRAPSHVHDCAGRV